MNEILFLASFNLLLPSEGRYGLVITTSHQSQAPPLIIPQGKRQEKLTKSGQTKVRGKKPRSFFLVQIGCSNKKVLTLAPIPQ
jgi:hypothetical protein